ncbi:MAG: hypothetical protein AAGK10_15890, partial [Cyanobacteria bacterium J06555_3]
YLPESGFSLKKFSFIFAFSKSIQRNITLDFRYLSKVRDIEKALAVIFKKSNSCLDCLGYSGGFSPMAVTSKFWVL